MSEPRTAHLTGEELEVIADAIPLRVVAAVQANMKNENEQRIKRGDPPLRPLEDREANALGFGAALAVDLLLRAIYETGEDQANE